MNLRQIKYTSAHFKIWTLLKYSIRVKGPDNGWKESRDPRTLRYHIRARTSKSDSPPQIL